MSEAFGSTLPERVLAAAVALLAGCAAPPSPPADRVPPGPGAASDPVSESHLAAAQAPPPRPRSAPLGTPTTLEGYRVQIAQRILDTNSAHTFEGSLPKVLKSVIVLQVTLDREGRLAGTELFRSNGYKALESTAHRSTHNAAPFAPPPREALRGGTFKFTETWLFRDDGKFQIRTLAGPQ